MKVERKTWGCCRATGAYVHTYSVRILIIVAPLVENQEHQPPEDAHQEQNLRNELQDNVNVALEVSEKKKRVISL